MKKKILLLGIFCLILCISTFYKLPVSNADSTFLQEPTFSSFEKIIDIDENKVLSVTEKLSVTFNTTQNLGIVRNISRANKIKRIVDGQTYENTTFARLYDVSVSIDGESEYFFVENDNEYYYINTGADEDYKLRNQIYNYEINYKYDMGEDFISAFDDFTFDIMDYGFPSTVKNFSSTITLPSNLTDLGIDLQSNLTFRSNIVGFDSTYTQSLTDDNRTQIKVESTNISKLSGITIQLILPNGYFETHFTPHILYYVLLGVCIVSVCAVLLIHLAIHKKNKCIITPEFYPPQGYSPIDVAKAYRGRVKPKDFAALIIDWASKGLIKIDLQDKKSISITKLKDYNLKGKSSTKEKVYFDALFKDGETFIPSHVYNDEISKAASIIYDKGYERTKRGHLPRILIQVFAFLPLLAFLAWTVPYLGFSLIDLFLLVFPLIAVSILLYTSLPIFFKAIWSLIFGGMPLLLIFLTKPIFTYDIWGLSYVAIILLVLLTITGLFVTVYSKEELDLRGKILGFKHFLVACEVQKLEMLIADDPQYFYNILPYCYVFGITKKMQKKFSALNQPDFTMSEENNMMLTYSLLTHHLYVLSTPYKTRTSGTIGHGGGFSGGGFGGSFGGGGGGGGVHGR